MQKSLGMAMGILLTVLTARTAQAQDVKTIVAKTNAVYHNMKSLKISLQTSMKMDAQAGSDVQTDAQFIPGKKANLLVTPKIAGKPMMRTQDGKMIPTPTGKQGAQVIDDGKTTYMLSLETYQYFKQPHNPNMLPIMGMKYGLPFTGMDPKGTYYKLLAPATVSGVSCYTLQLSPPPSKNGTTTVLIYIDKATYHVKQSTITQSNGKQTMSAQTLVKSEAINAPISDNVFTFTPPKGAQELKPNPAAPQKPAGK